MSKKFITAAVAILLTAGFVATASAATIHTPSPAQSDCMKSNPTDHKAYLACVQEKRHGGAAANRPNQTSPAKADTNPVTNPAGTTAPAAPAYNPDPSQPKYQ